MSQDLIDARKNRTFDADALTKIVWTPPVTRKSINRLVSILEKEPLFRKQDKYFLNRRQLLQRAFRMQTRLLELQQQHGWSRDTLITAGMILDDPLPFTLHFTAFIAVIEAQGTEEQISEWIPKSERMEVLGCYAQTELGHGSNVQGLETIATYVPETDEFEIHSPTLTSAKWWIGGLGVMATHALVQANLTINSKPYGPHVFIVPVRSSTDLSPLPNISIGDIGSKSFGGFASIDNGFVRFNQVRIPRKNMLQRHSQVEKGGNYVHAQQERMSYGSMITLRVAVVNAESYNLTRALTIAIRYTTIRRQFSSSSKEGAGKEDQVITYSSVKFRLFPLLGMAFAYLFASKELKSLYVTMMAQLKIRGKSTKLAEVHALSSGLKACSTWDCLAGIEECRKACGGHGYSAYSGIGHIWANGAPSQTYEGDNYVISQQTARACLKYMREARRKQPGPLLPDLHHVPLTDYLPWSAGYLYRSADRSIAIDPVEDYRKNELPMKILEEISRRAIFDLERRIQNGTPWKDLNMDCVSVARAHINVFLVKAFRDAVWSIDDESVRAVINKLYYIFSLFTLTKEMGAVLAHEIVSPERARLFADEYRRAVMDLTPAEAVQITDCFEYSDYELGSVLGRYDGKVYETLWEEVQKDPVNSESDLLREEVLKMMRGDWKDANKL